MVCTSKFRALKAAAGDRQKQEYSGKAHRDAQRRRKLTKEKKQNDTAVGRTILEAVVLLGKLHLCGRFNSLACYQCLEGHCRQRVNALACSTALPPGIARGLNPCQALHAINSYEAIGPSCTPSPWAVARTLGCSRKPAQTLFDHLMRREANLGRDLCRKMLLRTGGACRNGVRSGADVVLCLSCYPIPAGGMRCDLLANAEGFSPHYQVSVSSGPGSGKPPPESEAEIASSGLLARCRKGTVLFADGARGWCAAAKRRRLILRQVSHYRSQWTRKVRVRGCKAIAGTQQLDRLWLWLKRLVSSQLKSRQNGLVNPKLLDKVYQWVYRHNTQV
ncbi:unnamed protein product [Effrenium voratum]|nr:unnamed protein product [Effrenium voratum]